MAGERIVGKDAFSQGRQPDIKREEDRKEMERWECTQNALTMQALSVETLLLFITDLPPPQKKKEKSCGRAEEGFCFLKKIVLCI